MREEEVVVVVLQAQVVQARQREYQELYLNQEQK